MHNLALSSALICLCLAQSLVDTAHAQGRSGGVGADSQVDREIDRRVELQVERQVSANAERQVDQQIQRGVEQQLDKQVGVQVQNQVTRQAERRISHEAVANTQIGPGVDAARGPIAGTPAASVAPGKGGTPAGVSPFGTFPPNLERHFKFATDAQGFLYLKNQRLLLIDPATLVDLDKRGATYRKTTTLSGMGKVLVELDEADAAVLSELPGVPVPLDEVNHLYRYESAEVDVAGATTWLPYEALPLKVELARQSGAKVGLIDSLVERRHESLAGTQLRAVSFVEEGLAEPSTHGTAIMSILGGDSGKYRGLLPKGRFYSASIFYRSPEHGDHASVKSILLAMDWMAQNEVKVINMSLTGPHNPLLRQAVAEITKRGIFVVAAAGNGGPGAAPVYPAAYPGVIAVTALTRDNRAYYKANHGSYIDFAAPGVGITTASGLDGFAQVSGTSFAAPFVTAVVAMAAPDQTTEQVVRMLRKYAFDLGKPGVDDVFGYGKIRVPEPEKPLVHR